MPFIKGEELYGFLFISNVERKIYKYRTYRLNSAHAVIYLEKMNLSKKSQSKMISSYCSQPRNYFHLKPAVVDLIHSSILTLTQGLVIFLEYSVFLLLHRIFFFKICYCVLVHSFSATFFKVLLKLLLVQSLNLKYQLIPQSVRFYCSYFNTSLLCISCTDLYTENQFIGYKL